MIVRFTLLIDYGTYANFARFISEVTRSRSWTIRYRVKWRFFLLTTVCCLLLAMLAYPSFTCAFLSGGICSVGFSNDGATIVSVDDGSGQNVVAYDAVSGYIVSSTYSLLCKVVFYFFLLTDC